MDKALERTVEMTVAVTIDDLAQQIASLDDAAQRVLWERVAAINLEHGLRELSEMYRARLAREGKLYQTADDVLADLRAVRERVAAEDYDTLPDHI